MGQLGQTNGGFTFTISGTFGDAAGGGYTVPSPGIFVTEIGVSANDNGSAATNRLYVWKDTGGGHPGAWLVRSSGTFSMNGTMQWWTRTDIAANTAQISSDGYIPAGTVIWIGIYDSGGNMHLNGIGTGTTDICSTVDGNFGSASVAAGGFGAMSSYVNYNPLAAPTLSGVSPSAAPPGQTVTLTGTDLLHTTGITVCGVTASTYKITSNTSITFTIPSGATGAGNIVVTTPAGTASIAFVAGQVWWGDASGSGAVHSLVAAKYGDPSGSGVVHTLAGIWVPNGAGVKRIF